MHPPDAGIRSGLPAVLRITLLLSITTLAPTFAAYSPEIESPDSTNWTDGECSNCHLFAEGFSHRTGMRPAMKIGSGFPLEDGLMTCVTCHIADADTHAESRVRGTSALRGGVEGAAFCAQCHVEATARGSSHAMAIGRAHLFSNEFKVIKGDESPSDSCLSCHDGVISSDVSSGTEHTPLGQHPIDAPYSTTVTPTGSRMVSIESLDPRVRLFNERVKCASCHSVYSAEQHLTVMPNQASRLCLSCHKM